MEAFEGVVIGTIEYKEKSKIVELYTPFGKENILARGASKIQSNNLTFTMSLNNVLYNKTKADFPVLIDYQVKKSYFNILNNLNNTQVIMVFIQVIKTLGNDAPHNRIYPFFIKCLDLLLDGNNPLYVLSVFLIKMLAIFGVKPNFASCVICNNIDVISFSQSLGGALCKQCSNDYEVDNIHLEELKYLYYDKTYVDHFFDYNKILRYLYSYYLSHVSLRLKDYKI